MGTKNFSARVVPPYGRSGPAKGLKRGLALLMGGALVTGAAGFTGRYVVRALQSKGFRVVGAGLGTGPASNWISCDLTDTSAVNDAIAQVMPKVVVHLAGM